MEKSKKITLIIPAYNEENSIEPLIKKLNEVTGAIRKYKFSYLFINDGSTDKTLEVLKKNSKNYSEIFYIDLSRNFGKETAMLAGLDYADSDAVIIIDADLQHPPEVINEMISFWEQGYDDVYAVRRRLQDENRIRNFVSEKYYKIIQKITKERVYPNVGDFRLLDRKCVIALRDIRESERYMKGMYGWIGFKKKEIIYNEKKRVSGESKWNTSQLIKLAIDGITSYSTIPLKIWSYMGFFISFLSFLYLIYEIIKVIFLGNSPAGYPTLLAAVIFLGGIQLISLGVIGEYLSRVFIETKNRPPYFVREQNIKKNKKDI